ncbi:AAA family ATPase [Candidatus Nitrosocosmicus franklandus]|uniref:MCM2/3/5 family protein n=1 Tax=Candidatus Nitrosocosmicus franklandianus TaxID=1798806 RepID=A0A484IGH1_9ARCH|nr:AAA family ATPase [Candidatus Nitrosocosmicus franklandus]VFJ15290.1 MCM2/3/5 family protein [Candidatus Nitrosocosmicus franklandus]
MQESSSSSSSTTYYNGNEEFRDFDDKFVTSGAKRNTRLKKTQKVDQVVSDSDISHSPESIQLENSDQLFENIVGYDDVKKIFNYAINSSLPVHILLVGPPGSAKTLFLMECMKLPRSYFTLGSHSTKAGMLDYLFNHRPRNLIIDEIEYMAIKDQAALLSIMETGILSETKFEKTRKSVMRTWVFASCNNEKKLLTPLLSRFFVLYFKKYDFKTFERISNHILSKECNLDLEISSLIANLVWNKLKSRDIRDCIKIGRICKNKEDVNMIVRILKRYGNQSSSIEKNYIF